MEFATKLKELVGKYTPKRKKSKKSLEQEFDEASMAEEADDSTESWDSSLTSQDKKFMMDMMLLANEEQQKMLVATLSPMTEKLTNLEVEHAEMKKEILTLKKGVPPADLSSLKAELLKEIDAKFAASQPPPGIPSASISQSSTSSQVDPSETLYVIGSLGEGLEKSEAEEAARGFLQRAGCDEPRDLFAPKGLNTLCYLRWPAAQMPFKATCLMKRAAFRAPGQEFNVWIDLHRTYQQRRPKILIKRLEKMFLEVKQAESLKWRVVRCVTSRVIYLDKKEEVKLDGDQLVWSSSAVLDPRHRDEFQRRLLEERK